MQELEKIKRNQQLLDAIDWEMTPEEAVRLYLEWGNNWARGNYVIRSKDDVAHYFVINTWKEKPVVYFIRRNSEEAEELARIELPDDVCARFLEENGNAKGVYALTGAIRRWLQKELGQA